MNYLETTKREDETHLIEATYQKHLVDDEIFLEQQQQVSMIWLYVQQWYIQLDGQAIAIACTISSS